MSHKRLPTTKEVYTAIFKQHSEVLKPFSTFSAPTGSQWSPSRGQMMTEWGIAGADHPLMGIDAAWDIIDEDTRENVVVTYWLCIVVDD